MNKPSDQNRSIDTAVVLAEYNALRAEILKRVEFRFQVINLILIVAGTFLSVGVQASAPASIVLIYPPLAFFLVVSWVHNSIALKQIGKYIQEEIEVKLPDLAWETSGLQSFYISSWRFRLSTFSIGGITMITQLLSIIIALAKGHFGVVEIVLFIFSLIAVFLTFFLLKYRHIIKAGSVR
jgi:hypothetical protein